MSTGRPADGPQQDAPKCCGVRRSPSSRLALIHPQKRRSSFAGGVQTRRLLYLKQAERFWRRPGSRLERPASPGLGRRRTGSSDGFSLAWGPSSLRREVALVPAMRPCSRPPERRSCLVTDPPLDLVEVRVLGALAEKQLTTPEYYPLTLNALRTACNQKSNREPVVDLDDKTVVRAFESLREKPAGPPGQRRRPAGPAVLSPALRAPGPRGAVPRRPLRADASRSLRPAARYGGAAAACIPSPIRRPWRRSCPG